MLLVQLTSMNVFLVHVITGRLLLLVKLCFYSVVLFNHYLPHDLALSLEKNVLKELRILNYLQIKSAILIQKFQKKVVLKIYVFSLFHLVNLQHFSLKMKFITQNLSRSMFFARFIIEYDTITQVFTNTKVGKKRETYIK